MKKKYIGKRAICKRNKDHGRGPETMSPTRGDHIKKRN